MFVKFLFNLFILLEKRNMNFALLLIRKLNNCPGEEVSKKNIDSML